MALPDYFKAELGTAVVWGPASGTGVTATLSINALASGSAYQGAYVDLGAQFEDEYVLEAQVETGTAPTAGKTVDVWLISTDDTSRWPAKVTGSDGSYTVGTADANLQQAGIPQLQIVVTADANTALTQQGIIVRPAGRYVTVIYRNGMDQAIRNQGTPANNLSRVILVPRRSLIQDAA